jgi:SAM-dependent methyltransferase
MPIRCPLCRSTRTADLAGAHARRYLRCETCRLAFVPPAQRPGAAAELAHYGTHRNDPGDPGYRAFLERLAGPLAERLAPGASGLDYGSGPGPALPAMLRERGFQVELYDPFFAPDPAPLRRTYDFVACCETAEHFFDPAAELERLDALLQPGGWLGIMTQMWDESRDFGGWRYARDPTHVCFYHADTMRWIARRFAWELLLPGRDVALFRKPGADG